MSSPRTHIFLADGTLSQLERGKETNIGLIYRLLREQPHLDMSIGYHPGIRGEGLRKWVEVAAGIGINDMIKTGYAHIASHYRPGDRIMLFGYSRGAYAVRSLAGFIGKIGLLRQDQVTPARINRSFRYYEHSGMPGRAKAFCRSYCHEGIEIEFIGVFDTVKTLGLPYPLLSYLAPMATEFHDHDLGEHVQNAAQALALDETRTAFSPILWKRHRGWSGFLEQMWFAGSHGDVGGQVTLRMAARPLSNIPLIWMLDRATDCGLRLPDGWRDRYPRDPCAPAVGTKAGLGKYYLFRKRRQFGRFDHEAIHPSVWRRKQVLKSYAPRALGADTAEWKVPSQSGTAPTG